jgi:hypothetical protein
MGPRYKCCEHCNTVTICIYPDDHLDACEYGCNGELCEHECGLTAEHCDGSCQEDDE